MKVQQPVMCVLMAAKQKMNAAASVMTEAQI